MNNLTYHYLNDAGFRQCIMYAWSHYKFQQAWLDEEEDISAYLMAPHDFERDALYKENNRLRRRVRELEGCKKAKGKAK